MEKNAWEDDDDVDNDATKHIDAQEKRKRKRKRKVGAAEEEEEKASGKNPSSTEAPKRSVKKATTSSGEPMDGVYANERTVYMEGLPFDSTEDDVNKFFKEAGKIVAVRLPRWHDSGRLRGYGHVEFSSVEAASAALEMDGSYMGRRFIKITTPMTPRALQQASNGDSSSSEPKKERPPGCKTVFVKNIPYDCTDNDVEKAMMICGPIQKVRLAIWGHTNKLKGFGYVDFKREESCDIAIKKNGTLLIKGRPVIIDYEEGQAKGSYKPRK